MLRYLRPLAACVIVFQICVAIFTVPPALIPLGLQFELFLMAIGSRNSLVLSVLTSTATPLTFATGTLALVVALQRGQRRWAVAFIVLVLLSAYSPVLFAWVLIARTPLYVPETFTVNLPVLFLIDLLPQIFAVILAVVVLIYVYGLRDGRRSARHSEAQDETLQIERN